MQVSAEGKRGFILKNWLAQAVSKLALTGKKFTGFCKIMAVTHAKACIIAGCVVTVGTTGTVATAVYVNHANNNRQIVVAETVPTETEPATLKAVVTETTTEHTEEVTEEQTEEQTEEEVAPQDMNEEQITDMIESGDIEIIPIEELEIVDDNSTEPERNEDEVIEDPPAPEAPKSDQIYEVGQLVHGIDVSRWQGDIDWTRVANSGITFAMIKCGGGDDGLYEDRKFQQNIQGALANGIQVGIYFYSGARDVETAYREASFCVNLIRGYQITYPVAFDWELAYGDGSYDTITKVCETFCDVIAASGYKPMVYSNKYRWYDAFNGAQISNKYKVWMAAYLGDYYYTSRRWQYGDVLPNFDYHFDMWQYGVTNTVDGIDGYVDMNIAFFGYANYQVNGLQKPKIEVPSDNVTVTESEGAFDIWNGVKATNSIGYDEDLDYVIKNANGDEVTIEDANVTPGVYTIEYSFIDPKEGYTSRKVTLTVLKKEEETEKPTEKPTEGETGTGENPTTKASEESSSGTTAGSENKN